MKKQEFLNELSNRLSALPQNEIDKSIAYYDEIISDQIEDGIYEEDAIASLSDMDKIVKDIMQEVSLSSLMRSRISSSKEKAKNKGLWIALVIIGSPIWFPLMISFFLVLLSIYIVAWSIILTIYVIEISFSVSFLAGIITGIVLCVNSNPELGLVTFGLSFILAGITTLLFKPIILLTKQFALFTVFITKKFKSILIKKEAN